MAYYNKWHPPMEEWNVHLGMMGDHAECVRLEYKGETIVSMGRSRHHRITSEVIRHRVELLNELVQKARMYDAIRED